MFYLECVLDVNQNYIGKHTIYIPFSNSFTVHVRMLDIFRDVWKLGTFTSLQNFIIFHIWTCWFLYTKLPCCVRIPLGFLRQPRRPFLHKWTLRLRQRLHLVHVLDLMTTSFLMGKLQSGGCHLNGKKHVAAKNTWDILASYTSTQLMVNCWFGFLGSPYERDC